MEGAKKKGKTSAKKKESTTPTPEKTAVPAPSGTTAAAAANPNKKRKWADIQRERLAKAAAAGIPASSIQGTTQAAAAAPSKEGGGTEAKKSKRKKKKKKKSPKKKAKADSEDGGKDKDAASLEYLELWDKNRAQWKFRKLLQSHLLKIAYDSDKVSKEHWGMFVRYMLAVQGSARQKAVEEAKKVVAEGVRITENEEEKQKADTRRKRARVLLKALSKRE